MVTRLITKLSDTLFVSAQTGYCSTADVEVLIETTFTTTSRPTQQQVADLIFQQSDTIDIETKHAWRAITVTDETHDARWLAASRGFWGWEFAIKLAHRKIRSVTKLEYWNGSVWTDLVATGTERRGNDYWVNYATGQIFTLARMMITTVQTFRITYTYGETVVPGDIRLACAKMVAKEVVRAENRVELIVEGTSHFTWSDKARGWDDEIKHVMARHREWTVGVI